MHNRPAQASQYTHTVKKSQVCRYLRKGLDITDI